jgi:hypothetical protein
MSRHYRVPQSNDVEIDGLISEILENRTARSDGQEGGLTLSEGTVRLLMACKKKISTPSDTCQHQLRHEKVDGSWRSYCALCSLSAVERQKIEGIYAFMCR